MYVDLDSIDRCTVISLNTVVVNGVPFTWGIVSRRGVHRAGTRLFSRGIDTTGNVSNFVETEQLIEINGDRSSFVQTRGSIPLFWYQFPNLKYKPKPQVSLHEDHQSACARHFDVQIFHYGRQILVNLVNHILTSLSAIRGFRYRDCIVILEFYFIVSELVSLEITIVIEYFSRKIDQCGPEASLEEAYRNIIQRLNNQNVRYEAFDFHAECKRLRWDKLNILMDRLAHDQDQMGYFLLMKDGALLSVQDGVFRTNCIDCLDRTNVVQSMIAKRVLNEVLSRLEILRKVEDHPAFENLFKQVNIRIDRQDCNKEREATIKVISVDVLRSGPITRMW